VSLQTTERVAAIDAARGISVILMIGWHTADAWLDPALRTGTAFEVVRWIGGLAAPSFLLLAGTALALGAPSRPDRSWTVAVIRRAARLVVVGYGLSVFSWGVDHGAVLDPRARGPLGLAVLAVIALALGCADRTLDRRSRAVAALFGLALGTGALAILPTGPDTGRLLLLRVDVLHCIGASSTLTALALLVLARLSPPWRSLLLGAFAASIAAVAQASIGAPQRILPPDIARWIARPEPWSPAHHVGFPLIPWAAYVLAGAALGSVLRDGTPVRDRWGLPRANRPSLAFGLAVAIALFAADDLPPARVALARVPEAWSLLRLLRNAALVTAVTVAIAMARTALDRTLDGLALLGRHSLVIYAVHLELAFGLVGLPLRRTMGWGAWGIGAVALTLAALVLARVTEASAGQLRWARAAIVDRRVEDRGWWSAALSTKLPLVKHDRR
jgi:uncharacterized membrane protein